MTEMSNQDNRGLLPLAWLDLLRSLSLIAAFAAVLCLAVTLSWSRWIQIPCLVGIIFAASGRSKDVR